MPWHWVCCITIAVYAICSATAPAWAGVGDPQIATDHAWYPGELAVSTFDRLFATEQAVYARETKHAVATEEDRALAAWYWRNTHYCHGEEGRQDLWGKGFTGGDTTNREYWNGLFAHGFSLCGTTHAQWTAEMEYLLGHGRGRVVGVSGHNSFEAFLTGGPYGAGKWVLLDHDISTVVFDRTGGVLASIREVKADLANMARRDYLPKRQRGWLVSGLHPDDAIGVYDRYTTAEYFAGYAGPPPIVHLRRGETLRRYLGPGLNDGKTFVFWGRNYHPREIPGPQRDRTWVNQPEKMLGSRAGTSSRPGQARYGNAVYEYRFDRAGETYREAVIDESDRHVTISFLTPYVIGATPANEKAWGIYDAGAKNGLVIACDGEAGECDVSVSVDRGRTWSAATPLVHRTDLTDLAKGRRQYYLRFSAAAAELIRRHVAITTVCQANPAVMPRLADGGSNVRFEASNHALASTGLTLAEAEGNLAEGKFNTPRVALELATPHGEPAVAVYAAAQVASSNPPSSDVKYQIEYSTDGGKSYQPIVRDWNIPRRGDEPADFWSQSFCYGSINLPADAPGVSKIRVRFRNDGGKAYLRAELHLVYKTVSTDETKITFAWRDDAGEHTHQHVAPAVANAATMHSFAVPTGRNSQTRWIEMRPGGKEESASKAK